MQYVLFMRLSKIIYWVRTLCGLRTYPFYLVKIVYYTKAVKHFEGFYNVLSVNEADPIDPVV